MAAKKVAKGKGLTLKQRGTITHVEAEHRRKPSIGTNPAYVRQPKANR